MLRESHIDEMFQINKIMTDVLNNTEYFDLPICHPFCDVNKPISIFWDEFKKNGNDTDYDKDAIFSFPVSTVFGQEFFLGSNLFSVQSSGNIICLEGEMSPNGLISIFLVTKLQIVK
ncbi:unnamed protein product [Brugia timori]|uniref:Uncharacterized protein n=1 Tax=Brugia timori TaxID=42155 RepID=A0A0R3RD46_9BILA|nr:unnamed protein product [Brugia timori]